MGSHTYCCCCCCPTDVVNMKVTLNDQLRRCAENRSIWHDLLTTTSQHPLASPHINSPALPTTSQSQHATGKPQAPPQQHNRPMPTMTFNCIADSLIWVSRGRDSRLLVNWPGRDTAGGEDVMVRGIPECVKSASHVQVLCTGSLHLVGDILSLLDPDVCDK